MVTPPLEPEKRGSHFEKSIIGQQTAAAQEKDGDSQSGNFEKSNELEIVDLPKSN